MAQDVRSWQLFISSTLCEAIGFADGKPIDGALVPTWIQSDTARFVVDVAVLGRDAGALQRDVCPLAAQRGPPCNKRKHFLKRHLQEIHGDP